MDVQHAQNLGAGHSIELGRATWDNSARSIRNRYATAGGGFSPRSSSEIPIGDLVELVAFAAMHDELTAAQSVTIIQHLAASIQRQRP